MTQYYLFALYLFVLIAILILLVWRIVSAQKGKRSVSDEEATLEKEKEERLFRLYQNIEEMMDNFESYIEDTRAQMETMKGEIQQQAGSINGLLNRVEATEASARAAVAALRTTEKPDDKHDSPQAGAAPQEEPTKMKTRQDTVRELLGKGNTVEQIAQKLELSINEVRLIVYGLMTKDGSKKQ
jgi:hypothetical protein